jgi:arginine decarboxylase
MSAADQQRAPFVESLRRARALDGISFHMPGHKYTPDLLPEMVALFGEEVFRSDLNECDPGVDYLHAAKGALAEAQHLAAELIGAEHTFFLINGSTVGNQVALMAAVSDGQPVLIPRASHRSVYAALILSGAVPVYIPPVIHPDVGFPLGVDLEVVDQLLAAHPDIRAIHVTSPNYYGYLSDVAALVERAHARAMPLLVDEAHGAHLPYHPALPRSAVQHGADVVVQSAHKTIGALTQAALLHIQGDRVPLSRLQHLLALLQSSSPSVLLTASLDAARQQMAREGQTRLTTVLQLAATARETIRQIPGLWCYGDELIGSYGIAAHDPTKLVIRVRETGMNGTAFAARLSDCYGITVEFADMQHLIASITIADDEARVERLLAGLRGVAAMGEPTADRPLAASVPQLPPIPPLALNPRQATFAPSRVIPLEAAVDAICAEQIMPYPPGIPLVMPGEVLTAEMIAYLRDLLAAHIRIVGPQDTTLRTVRVMSG